LYIAVVNEAEDEQDGGRGGFGSEETEGDVVGRGRRVRVVMERKEEKKIK